MNKKFFIKLIALLGGVLFTGVSGEEINPILHRSDSSYTIEYVFKKDISDSELMEILYRFNHLRQYVNKTNLTLTLVSENEKNNQVKYFYNYLLANMEIVMNRSIQKENELFFCMETFTRSRTILPQVHKTSGGYEISKDESGKRVIRYWQSTTMDRKITWIFEKIIIAETKSMLTALIKYMDDHSKTALSIQTKESR